MSLCSFAGDSLILADICVENYSDGSRISIRTNRYFEYFDYNLDDKALDIVFDPAEPLYFNLQGVDFDKKGLINDIKFVKSAVRKEELPAALKKDFYPLDYLLISLNKKTDYRISQRANLVAIEFGKKSLPPLEEFVSTFKIKDIPSELSAPAQTGQPPEIKFEAFKPSQKGEKITLEPEPLNSQPMREPPGYVLPRPRENPAGWTFKQLRDDIMDTAVSEKSSRMGLPKDKNRLSYEECLRIGTVNFLPIIIAEEEIKLNDMKVKEARRGLYPTAVAKYAVTEGKATGVEFREKSYGLQFEQPFYYGGRLKLALREAEVNRQVARSKFDKVEADIVSKITDSFYNMATAQLNLQDQRQLLAASREIFRKSREKYDLQLITKLEMLNVESQRNQIDYQLAVAVKDLQMAGIGLLQAIGVEPSAEISVEFSLDHKERALDLNKCLLLAYQNRPELEMNDLLRQASEYEEKIARSKDDFKVDFTGFVGQSGGAYKTESLNLGSDWYVGFKASKPWLGSTGSYNYAKNKTSPKLGQSTRTEGSSHTFEFGILNNLTGYSEKQSALIGKLKAENDLIEMEKSVNLEVREAFNNYQKAIIQINNAKNKIAFREEELMVLKAQSEINEALLSQVLEGMVKLNDEKALYHQAIASYKTALANLNKAIGIVGYF